TSKEDEIVIGFTFILMNMASFMDINGTVNLKISGTLIKSLRYSTFSV
ncbi:13531_t:CDS:1, partial [Gigaspora rosea]